MNNGEYWKKRFELLEQAAHQQGVQCYADIEKQYRQAQKQLEGQIAAWYQRFASNNGVTLAEAKRMLNAKELAELKWDVNQYIQYGQENAINGTWVKQLENASARFHISRLEALKLQTQQSIEVMFGNQLDSIDSTMRNVYKSGYYHTAYEIQKGVGVGWDFSALDDKQISKVINKPWAVDGKNFSERIWGNRQKLVNELNNTLTQNIILGKDPQKAIDEIARKMNTSKTNAGRLVMTEEAFFSSAAQKDCFTELDVEQFEIVATLDSHTSDICRGMDGKHFPMSEWKVGVTAPPFHVHCRSTTVPYFDDEFDAVGERAARDEETGKTYFVPGNMTYKEWENAFVNGGDKSDMKEVLPDDIEKPIDKAVLKQQISDTSTQIDDLKKQFGDTADGYSYDEWFKEFDSIEDGFGGTYKGDKTFDELTELDSKIRELTQKKDDLKNLLYENMSVDEVKEEISNNNNQITALMSEYTEKHKQLEKAMLFGGVDVPTMNKLQSDIETIQASVDELKKQNDEWNKLLPERVQVSHATVVNGSDLSGNIDYSTGKFEHDIETALNAQGFDGTPSVVEYDDFKKAMEESGFYAERTYAANTQELLDTYRNELYNGKWYVDCSEGGSQYGQGMYCASCYDLSDNHSLGGIGFEMSHYQEIGMSKGNAYSYTESLTLQPGAKIFDLPNGADAMEYISDKYAQHYMLKNATDKKLVKDINEYFGVQDKLLELGKMYDAKKVTLAEYEKQLDALYDYRDSIYNGSPEFQAAKKKAMEQQMYQLPDMKYPKLKDPGTLAAEMGYDAIKADGHGDSGSYTVILNRTKVIFCKGGSIYGN